ncbi:MAG: acetate--CoA ligase family protein, partial [Desulfobacterales bacterium]|nr:acetate--CoA ligase family protein [Desulfobacterales bacterium]
RVVSEPDDLEKFKFPYFLKVDSPGHKSDMHGVLKVEDLEHAAETLSWMHNKFPENKIVAQESFSGIEMIVGIKSDEVFGKLLMIGFGGIYAEVKRDVSFRALPVSRKEIAQMLTELSSKGIFNARGKNYDLNKFVDLIERVLFVCDKKGVKELDLNPVMVGEKCSKIVDARVKI